MNLSILIKKYRNYILIIFFLIAGVFIVTGVIIPQFNEIKVLDIDVNKERNIISNLQNTLNVLNNVPVEKIDRDFELTNKALPQVKDIVLIYNELLVTSQKTGVKLGNLRINVGDVYSKVKKKEEAPPEIGSPSLNITIKADGKADQLKEFAGLLYRVIPLVEINKLSIANDTGNFTANFFYNPYVSENTDLNVSSKPIDQKERVLLDQLRIWERNSIPIEPKIINSSQNNNQNVSPSPSVSRNINNSSSASPSVSPKPTSVN